MARRLSWSDVRGGLIACCALALIVIGTLEFSRLGALHGDTFTLYALVGEARGVLVGSEVWLSGQKIGKITDIKFRSPTASDSSARLEIKMDVLEKYRTSIRHDAIAQIQNGGSFVGAPVVYLTPGTLRAAELRGGDTVRSRPQTDAEGATGEFAVASREFPVIINNVKLLAAQLATTEGTVGAFLHTPEGRGVSMSQLARTQREAERFMRLVTTDGSLGSSHREALINRAMMAVHRADSLRVLLLSPSSSYMRARGDSTLMLRVSDVRNELSIVRTQLDTANGTAGRVLRDSALVMAVHSAEGEMSSLVADMKKHPLRYIRF